MATVIKPCFTQRLFDDCRFRLEATTAVYKNGLREIAKKKSLLGNSPSVLEHNGILSERLIIHIRLLRKFSGVAFCPTLAYGPDQVYVQDAGIRIGVRAMFRGRTLKSRHVVAIGINSSNSMSSSRKHFEWRINNMLRNSS